MKVLAIDIGSSSVKAAVLTGDGVPASIARATFATRYEAGRAEVDAGVIERALYDAVGQLSVRGVDLIAPTGMAPSWLAMDRRGRAITPVVTHQDRRSLDEAIAIQKAIGAARHLRLTGNNPVPGGISSTTYRWFNAHARGAMKKADLVGHLNTWLLRSWCGVRAIDTSNASFTGLFNTCTLKGWSAELIEAAGAKAAHLPAIFEANQIVGRLTESAAGRLGVGGGTPVLAGIMDGSCAMLLAGAEQGQAVHVMGSTDVLAVCTDRARPCADLLTRALGVGPKWLSVGTIAASGSAIEWVRQQMFRDLPDDAFYALLESIATQRSQQSKTSVAFSADFVGSRTAVESTRACIANLDLGATREQLLDSLCESLAVASWHRLVRYGELKLRLKPTILTSGGKQRSLATILHRHWHKAGRFRFVEQDEPTLRGLWKLAQIAKQ